ncbi:expressed unknown protein [Seminavis robusta]|uniref:Uncharacterized protein n=1 Tax=Seminavis robusta TaxID=568900 RepID=A0A9N8EF82_9STRA|nr:expressed unknown protein [Seminavis robusta]|eukprot:Sro905_g218480.1 n/a (142) ;mRNA; f:8608-9097
MKKATEGVEDEAKKAEQAIKSRDDTAFQCLYKAVEKLANTYEDSMKEIFKAAPSDGLKLVIALDEGSIYPTIVRSIIGERTSAADQLRVLFADRFGVSPTTIRFFSRLLELVLPALPLDPKHKIIFTCNPQLLKIFSSIHA